MHFMLTARFIQSFKTLEEELVSGILTVIAPVVKQETKSVTYNRAKHLLCRPRCLPLLLVILLLDAWFNNKTKHFFKYVFISVEYHLWSRSYSVLLSVDCSPFLTVF